MENHFNALPNFEKEKESADEDKMGMEDILALNPPLLNDSDLYVWKWHRKNMNQLVLEYNLLPMLLKRLNLEQGSFEVFLTKLNMIHQTMQRIWRREADKEK